ncbi:selenocysteine-specific translation elongation factor [Desulfovibrio sp. OttesenSCG-928-I05]|nr:selenocysteine-specific translation elongation factor [Desulfovibrio sp. OttesenSCG-928-I05]
MPVVMGTAGHIDHGKTSLVRALTTIDCDRLEEEKRRGITIELGFAYLDFPEGRRLSIVDMPGHEKFVKTMVAGASGIDFVLLVIAADEGVMPQTREHLEICTLLGIRTGLVAVTKTDMVDPELLDMALEDIASTLQGTFLENAPVYPVSAHSGEGLSELRDALRVMEKELAPPRMQDIFRLPVDRVFTMKGHGTVVTGTMTSGSVSVGDEVMLYPSGKKARVRSLQSHWESVTLAPSGRRTAVNLQGLELEDVSRGDVLAHVGELISSTSWEAHVTCLSSSPRSLRHRGEVHLHHGTREMMARLYFRDVDSLAPGQSALCQIRFQEPVTAIYGDRFILRSFSPLRTVAGGVVLHPLGLNLTRRDPAFAHKVALLGALPDADEDVRVLTQIELAGQSGARFAELCLLTGLESKRLEKVLASLSGKQQAFSFDRDEKRYISQSVVDELSAACVAYITTYHQTNTLKSGISRGALASGWGKTLPAKLVHFITERLVKQGTLEAEADTLRIPGHSITLGAGQQDLRDALKSLYLEAGFTPPTMKEALEALKVSAKELDPVLRLLVKDGELVRVEDGLYYPKETLEVLRDKVREWFAGHDDLDPAGFRDLTGLSRKFAIPLLEHFDATRLTVRVGNQRVLRAVS